VPHSEDPFLEAVKAARLDPTPDRSRPDAERDQLVVRDHTVLLSRQPRNPPITWGF
jgi:hypothetical protein